MEEWIRDESGDFRDEIDFRSESEAVRPGGKPGVLTREQVKPFPQRSLRLSTLSKVRLCVEILATNKTQSVLAREHGCTRQAVSYYARAMLPHRRRIKPVILFKQGELDLFFG